MTSRAVLASRRRRRLRQRVILDTGPLYALLDSRDSRHSDAVKLFELLEQEHANVACAYLAATEAHRLILTRSKVPVERAHTLIAEALAAFAPVMPTLEDAGEAQESLKYFNDQKISLTDATIAATALRESRAVVTFDRKQRHFELMGAEVYI